MLDMKRQVREYAGHLDEVVAPIEVSEIVENRVLVYLTAPTGRVNRATLRLRSLPRWAVAASSAIVVLLVVGGMLLLTPGSDSGFAPTDETPLVEITDPPAPTDLDALPQGVPGLPAFRAQVNIVLPHPLDLAMDDLQAQLEESLGVGVTAVTAEELDLRFDILYRPGPFGGVKVALSDQSRGIDLLNDPLTYGVFNRIQTGVYRSSIHQFDIIESGSFESVLGTLLWSNWTGVCDTEPVETVDAFTIAGRVVDQFTCASLRGSADVWVDRETLLVLRVESEDLRGSLPGGGLLATVATDLAGYSVLEIVYEPEFVGDEFALRPPEGAVVIEDPEPPAGYRNPRDHPLVGQPAPEIAGPLFGGDTLDVSELRGRRVAVLWWASWCLPCLDTLQAFQMYADANAPDFEMVTVTMQDRPEAAIAVLQRGSVELPAIDGSSYPNSYFRETDIIGVPALILIDESGTVVAVQLGVDPLGDLFELVGWAP